MFGFPIPMPVLAGLEAFAVTVLYALIFVAAPAWALSRRLEGMRLCERFLIYIVFGNFSVINIVLLLELLHISHAVIVAAAYVGLLLFLRWKLYGSSPLQFLQEARVTILKLAHRTITWRQVWLKRKYHPLHGLKKKLMGLLHTLPSAILLVLCLVGIAYVFGINYLSNYGYPASDSPVHNYWINGLIDNKPFVAGVYPMGYHCEVYAIHIFSGIPVYVILRIIGFVQTFYFILTLVAFLRAICRSWIAPCVGLLPFLIDTGANYSRYVYGVPQENGVMFIFPALWCAFRFFAQYETERKGRLDGSIPKMRFLHAPSTRWLAGFAMGLSLTIAVHFYDFLVFALFLVAGAICYSVRLIRPQLLWRILVGGLAGVVVAALPMVIAFALGTPLQASLGWGLNQMEDEEDSQVENVDTSSTENASSSSTSSMTSSTSGMQSQGQSTNSVVSGPASSASKQEAPKPSIGERVALLVQDTVNVCSQRVSESWGILSEKLDGGFGRCYLCFALAVVVVGVVLRFLKQGEYGLQVATMGLSLIVMGIQVASAGLPWPTLMPTDRMVSLLCILAPSCFAVGFDGLCVLATVWTKRQLVLQVVSGTMAAALAVASFSILGVQKLVEVFPYETNGNIICLERILREYRNFTWTIVSANDELRMSEKYGYHSEINEILNNMERSLVWEGTTNDFTYRLLPAKGSIIIPTEYVFFFIDKVPTQMNLMVEDSTVELGLKLELSHGETISEEWANNILPGQPTIASYRGKNRLIEMSRMYFWAQEYMKRYPNEMKTFYEDDEMICYRLHQPVADWLDLYIDYGYNDLSARLKLSELTNGALSLSNSIKDGETYEYHSAEGTTQKADDKTLKEDGSGNTNKSSVSSGGGDR